MQQKIPKYEHKKHPKHKPWWNPELKQVRKELTIAEKKWLSCKDRMLRSVLRDRYKHLGRKFSSYNGQKGQEATQLSYDIQNNLANLLSENQANFWTL